MSNQRPFRSRGVRNTRFSRILHGAKAPVPRDPKKAPGEPGSRTNPIRPRNQRPLIEQKDHKSAKRRAFLKAHPDTKVRFTR